MGVWAYAQPDMTLGEAAFTLATGLLGRLYLSGRLDLMRPEQRGLVRDAVTVHKRLSREIAASVLFWPLGLTAHTGPWWRWACAVPAAPV
ncbi:hypothetical protein [Streptomyces sp. KR80]|uniref:hypothetical protein n=1 Tax=Streptomyces sp. KR80 TaxID=3457426 RepID=UPI003FD1A94F